MPFEFILFDLDDTLYSGNSGLLQEIGRRIQRWLCEHLNLTWEEAAAVRRDYFVRYGTTLNGLVVEHQIDAHDYLTFVHDIPVASYLGPDPALATMLAAIPLQRIIYTNATTEYSWRVLRVLGVDGFFERVVSIEDVGLRNKLYLDAYERALALIGARGPECIMVEDSARNLTQAKALGMTTVLVANNGATRPTTPADEGVDFIVSSVLKLGEIVQALQVRHPDRR